TYVRRWPLATFSVPLAGHARLASCGVYVELTLAAAPRVRRGSGRGQRREVVLPQELVQSRQALGVDLLQTLHAPPERFARLPGGAERRLRRTHVAALDHRHEPRHVAVHGAEPAARVRPFGDLF